MWLNLMLNIPTDSINNFKWSRIAKETHTNRQCEVGRTERRPVARATDESFPTPSQWLNCMRAAYGMHTSLTSTYQNTISFTIIAREYNIKMRLLIYISPIVSLSLFRSLASSFAHSLWMSLPPPVCLPFSLFYVLSIFSCYCCRVFFRYFLHIR